MKLPNRNSPRWFSLTARSQWFNLAVIWLAWSIAIVAAYYHTNIVFLRAESGWYQAISQMPHRHQFLHYFTNSYHGHYTPFAFAAEIEISHWFGPRETPWKWRQLTGMVALATSLSVTAYAAAKSHGLARWNAIAVASGLTALFIFQPHMLEFVAWPVLIFFSGTLICSTLALFALIQLARNPTESKWIWLAAGAAYLSLHCTGLGLISVLATGAVLSGLLLGIFGGRLPQFSSSRRALLVALGTLVLVAMLHTFCMLYLRKTAPGGPSMDHLNPLMMVGLMAASFFSACQAILVFRLLPSFHAQLILSMWPWGVFLSLAAVILIVGLVRNYLRAPNTERLVQVVLHAFSVVAFAAFIFLGLVRSVAEPGDNWTLTYLLNSRYLVMANFALFGSFCAIAILVGRKAGRFCAILFLSLFLTVFAANKQYYHSAFPDLGSNFNVRHGKGWRAVAAMARECRAANLPVPDVSMRMISEFDWPLHYYEPLLQFSLGLKPDEKIQFVEWKGLDDAARQRYRMVAPSLSEVIKRLSLEN